MNIYQFFEWCIFKILRYNLDQEIQTREKKIDINSAGWACAALLSVLSFIGSTDENEAEGRFQQVNNPTEPAQDYIFQC